MKAQQFYTDLGLLLTVLSPTENIRIQGLFKAFELFSSTFQGRFNFQGLFKKALWIQELFKPVRTLCLVSTNALVNSNGADETAQTLKQIFSCTQIWAYLFLFSTSATNSSVENDPFTTMISCLITSSEQSTSNNPPITTGKRAGFTWKNIWAVTCDLQQCGILTSVDSDEPVQTPFKLRNSKCCSIS